MSEIRDVVVVLLGSVLMRMEMNKKFTVGNAADMLIELLEKEGIKLIRKEDLRRAVEAAAEKIAQLHVMPNSPDTKQ